MMTVAKVHGVALAITITALILSCVMPADIRSFAAFLTILSATAALAVTMCLWALGWRPALEPDIQPLKSALADYGSFWGGAAILLLLIATGNVPD